MSRSTAGSQETAEADLIAALEGTSATAPPLAIAKLLGDLERLKAVFWHRLVQTTANAAGSPSQDALDDLRHLTPAQVGELLNLKPAYIHELCRSRKLPATKSGKYWMIPVAELRRWLATSNRDVEPKALARLPSVDPRSEPKRTERKRNRNRNSIATGRRRQGARIAHSPGKHAPSHESWTPER
jgi:excisionase family DNA binding protein